MELTWVSKTLLRFMLNWWCRRSSSARQSCTTFMTVLSCMMSPKPSWNTCEAPILAISNKKIMVDVATLTHANVPVRPSFLPSIPSAMTLSVWMKDNCNGKQNYTHIWNPIMKGINLFLFNKPFPTMNHKLYIHSPPCSHFLACNSILTLILPFALLPGSSF